MLWPHQWINPLMDSHFSGPVGSGDIQAVELVGESGSSRCCSCKLHLSLLPFLFPDHHKVNAITTHFHCHDVLSFLRPKAMEPANHELKLKLSGKMNLSSFKLNASGILSQQQKYELHTFQVFHYSGTKLINTLWIPRQLKKFSCLHKGFKFKWTKQK